MACVVVDSETGAEYTESRECEVASTGRGHPTATCGEFCRDRKAFVSFAEFCKGTKLYVTHGIEFCIGNS